MQEKAKILIQSILDRAVAAGETVGCSALIRKDGQELCFAASGLADREENKPIRRDTIFRLYSMSKPITGVAAVKLAEEGKLDLSQPVGDFLPSFRGQRVELPDGSLAPVDRPMKVADLLRMTSGLPYDGPGRAGRYAAGVMEEAKASLNTDTPIGTLELAEKLGQGPLAFQPGSSWRYGTSADVLGAVIEAVSGKRFGDYLEDAIFAPLGMHDTAFWVPPEKQWRLAAVYTAKPDGSLARYDENHLDIRNHMDRRPAFESGGGGLASTADDYARFAAMLLNGGELDGVRVLSSASVRYLTSPGLNDVQRAALEKDFDNLPGYSYNGLMRVLVEPGRANTLSCAGDYGWDGWLGCYFENVPAQNMTVLLFMQRTDTGYTPLARRLRDAAAMLTSD